MLVEGLTRCEDTLGSTERGNFREKCLPELWQMHKRNRRLQLLQRYPVIDESQLRLPLRRPFLPHGSDLPATPQRAAQPPSRTLAAGLQLRWQAA